MPTVPYNASSFDASSRSSFHDRHRQRFFRPWLYRLEDRTLLDSALGEVLVQDPGARYVANLYQDLLTRSPSPEEQAQWVQGLTTGASREAIAQGFLASPERREGSLRDHYFTLLGRAASTTEIAWWQTVQTQGMTAEQATVGFLTSEEYVQKQGGNTAGWLNGVYRDLLGRQVDEEGRTYWQAQLNQGVSHADVTTAIQSSTEAHTRTVEQVYQTLLRRAPDEAGLSHWLAALQQGMTRDSLLVAVAASGEYSTLTPLLPADEFPNESFTLQFREGAESALDQLQPLIAFRGVAVQATGQNDIYRLRGAANQLAGLANSLLNKPYVIMVSASQTVHLSLTPNDPHYVSLNGMPTIQAAMAWDFTVGSTKVVIADIDSGVDYTHEDLYQNVWINQAEIPSAIKSILLDRDSDGLVTFWDLNDPVNQGPGKIVDFNNDGRIDGRDLLQPAANGGWANGINEDNTNGAYVDDLIGWNFQNNTNNPLDDNGHGTHVAGILGAVGNNAVGVVGVNWKTQIMPLKFLGADGKGLDDNGALAIRYATDHGSRISNNSWSGLTATASLSSAIGYAESKGHLVVAAAGNNGANLDTNPEYPAAFTNANIISVAAVDSSRVRLSTSNYGATSVDLGAPGQNILSTLPGNSYGSMSGTSAAAPFVAGTAGLILARQPGWTSTELKTQISTNVFKVTTLAGITSMGGVVYARNSLRFGPAIRISQGSTQVPPGSSVSFNPAILGATITKTFTIQNVGLSALTLGSAPTLPPGFVLVSGFGATTLGQGASTSFTIQFPTTTPGASTGVVAFATNEPSLNPFQFTVSGSVAASGIVDDGDPGFSTSGGFQPYATGGYQSDVYFAPAGTGSNVATWTIPVGPGIYRIATTWTAFANRATNAPYTISDNSVRLGTVRVNQELAPDDFSSQGGTWETLGVWTLTGPGLSVQLSDDADEMVIADAIHVERIGDVPTGPELRVTDGTTELTNNQSAVSFGTVLVGRNAIRTFTVSNIGSQTLSLSNPTGLPAGFTLLFGLDSTNLPPGASTTFTLSYSAPAGVNSGVISLGSNDPDESSFRFSVAGTSISTVVVDDGDSTYSSSGFLSYPTGGFQSDVQYKEPGDGSSFAKWSYNVSPGLYKLATTWSPWTNRATNAPYTIRDNTTVLGTVRVDQEVAPSDFSYLGTGWRVLGTYNFSSSNLDVRLTDDADEMVIADALYLERLDGVPSGPEIRVKLGNNEIPDETGSVSFGTVPSGGATDLTLTVTNIGSQPLSLSNPISVPAGFSVVGAGFSTSSLVGGGSTSFTLRFSPIASGFYSGTVSFANGDGDESPFNFTVTGSAVNRFIIDNGDASFFTNGFTSVSGEGYQNDIHRTPGQSLYQVNWQFASLTGRYRVAATWTPGSDRTADAPFVLYANTKALTTVHVNQQIAPDDVLLNGVAWEVLGDINLANETLNATLTSKTPGSYIADAVYVERLSDVVRMPEIEVAQGSTILVDGVSTVDFGSTIVGTSISKHFTVRNIGDGPLTVSNPTNLPPGFRLSHGFGSNTIAGGAIGSFDLEYAPVEVGAHGGTIRFSNGDADENPFEFTVSGTLTRISIVDDDEPGFDSSGFSLTTGQGYKNDLHSANIFTLGAGVATWSFPILPGRYRVAATWPAKSDQVTNAPFTIPSANGVGVTVRVNQKALPTDFSYDGVLWTELGTFNLNTTTLLVMLEIVGSPNSVVADGVYIERLGPVVPQPEIEVFDSQTALGTGTPVSFGTRPLNTEVVKTITVRNSGDQNLTLGNLINVPTGYEVIGTGSPGFPVATLAPGISTTFGLRFKAASAGDYNGIVSFSSNDPDENPFSFPVTARALDTVIIDDGDPGFSSTGMTTVTPSGYQGDYREFTAGSNPFSANWTVPVEPGRYRIATTWVAKAGSAFNVKYGISAGQVSLTDVLVDQTLSPGEFSYERGSWKTLAILNLTGPMLQVGVTNPVNGAVSIDALLVERMSDVVPSPEIRVEDDGTELTDDTSVVMFTAVPIGASRDKRITILNRGDRDLTLANPISVPTGFSVVGSGFSASVVKPGDAASFTLRYTAGPFSAFGEVSFGNNDENENPFRFEVSGVASSPSFSMLDDGDLGFSATGGFRKVVGSGYHWDLRYTEAGTGTSVASWSIPVTPGRYKVSVTWAQVAGSASNAPFTIMDGSTGLGTVAVNQQLVAPDFSYDGQQWKSLGAFLVAGTNLVVQLTDKADGVVIADAVLVERLGDLPPLAPEIQVLRSDNYDIADGDTTAFFGDVAPGVTALGYFTVKNLGTQTLTLTPPISVPAQFSVFASFGVTSLGPGEQTVFVLAYTGAAGTGTSRGPVSFGNNDADENPFDFFVSGTTIDPKPIAILDDGDSGFSANGSFLPWPTGGYQSDVYYALAGTGSSVATWTFPVSPGIYKVATTWSAYVNRATNSPFTIKDGTTALQTVLVNQELLPNDFSAQGGAWKTLGNFTITGSSLVVQLTDNANEMVVADAVYVERVGNLPPAEPEIQVLDGTTDLVDGKTTVVFGNTANGSTISKTFTVKNLGTQTLTLSTPISTPAGFVVTSSFGTTSLAPGASTNFTLQFTATTGTTSGTVSFGNNDADENPFDFTITGSATSSSPISIIDDGDAGFRATGAYLPWPTGGYQSDVYYSLAGNGSSVATWTFPVTPGIYKIAATWSAFTNRATNSPFTIKDGAAALGTVLVNQELLPNDFNAQGGTWKTLGTFSITGSSLIVELSDNANEMVVADAIYIERIGDLPSSTPEIQVLCDGADIADGSGVVNFGSTVSGGTIDKTFTVKNVGLQPLVLSNPITLPTGFSVVSGFGTTTLAAGATTTFTLRFTGTTGSVSGPVSFGNNDADENPFDFTVSGSVVAGSPIRIIDDGDAGFNATGNFQSWPTGGYQSDVYYALAGSGSSIATWTFNNLTPGTYKVAATWSPYVNRATNSPFTIKDGATSLATILVNQEATPSDFSYLGVGWKTLGNFNLSGNTLIVQLTDNANEMVVGDAIYIERIN